jgi:hypothetical protein
MVDAVNFFPNVLSFILFQILILIYIIISCILIFFNVKLNHNKIYDDYIIYIIISCILIFFNIKSNHNKIYDNYIDVIHHIDDRSIDPRIHHLDPKVLPHLNQSTD